jgi:hypothetical protein
VVEEKPAISNLEMTEQKRGVRPKNDACWRLRGRVWTGPAASADVEPFNWCASEMRFNVGYADVALWAGSAMGSARFINTGGQRTLGPDPPQLPLPRAPGRDYLSDEIILAGNLLLDMGFQHQQSDPRVWFIYGNPDAAMPVKADRRGSAATCIERRALVRKGCHRRRSAHRHDAIYEVFARRSTVVNGRRAADRQVRSER